MDAVSVKLCKDKGRAPLVRRVLGTWCNGVMHGLRGHMWARTAPTSPLEWMEYVPAWGPMTRGALPSCVFPLARGALGSCMGLEGTCGSHALVQATVGVGTVLIWDFCVATTKEGYYIIQDVHRVSCPCTTCC